MIEIKQKDLKAVALAMAVKDIRYYLQGVYVESNGTMTRIVATDGHRLHIVQTEDRERPVSPIVSFLMPFDLVKHCLKVKGPRQDKEPRIMLDYSETGKIEARLPDGSSIVASAIDGKFPDYLRIVRDVYALKPDNEGQPLAQVFNQSYVSDAAEALAIYLQHKGSTPPDIGLRPRGSSVGVLACGEFLALVMPMRGELSPLPNPSFGEPLQAPEPLQAVA
jgi:DNA polymerase-3 subunit beta